MKNKIKNKTLLNFVKVLSMLYIHNYKYSHS